MDQIAFNEFVTNTILDTISAILGPTVSNAYTKYLETHNGIYVNDLTNHLDVVSASLKASFGVGGGVLERAIVRTFYKKVGIELNEVAGRSIVDVVNGLRQKLVIR